MDSAKGTTFRNHCLDDGLASIAEMETGGFQHHHQYPPFVSKNPRSSSLRNVSWGSSSSSSLSPRSAPIRSFFVAGKFFEEPQKSHFLDSCFLCKKLLGCNKDIFMYRGDTPFCSEECRQEQIEMDEAKEKSRNLSASIRALRKKEQTKSSSSSSSSTRTTSSDSTFRSTTVAAAS